MRAIVARRLRTDEATRKLDEVESKIVDAAKRLARLEAEVDLAERVAGRRRK